MQTYLTRLVLMLYLLFPPNAWLLFITVLYVDFTIQFSRMVGNGSFFAANKTSFLLNSRFHHHGTKNKEHNLSALFFSFHLHICFFIFYYNTLTHDLSSIVDITEFALYLTSRAEAILD